MSDTGEHLVEFHESFDAPWEEWAGHAGSRRDAVVSALCLLQDLHDRGRDEAEVRVDGESVDHPACSMCGAPLSGYLEFLAGECAACVSAVAIDEDLQRREAIA